MAAVGCLEKEIQFQKEAIKEQDARQAQDMPLTKNIHIQLKTFLFPAIRREQIRRSADVGCPVVDIPCSPGCASLRLPDIPFLPKGASAIPAACSCPGVARQRSCRHGSGPSAPLADPESAVPHPPFPGHGTKTLPASRRRRPAVHSGKKFYGERGPGGGGRFFKSALLPRKTTQAPPSKN